MEEVFPVLAGVVVGLVTSRVMQTWLRVIAVVLLGLAFGAIASWISGELALSWVYVVIDTAQGHRRKRHDHGPGQSLAPPPRRTDAR
jgi:hypothetical protein